MKILYVANERRAAQLAAKALRDVAPNLRLTWAGTLSPALRWVEDNRDAAALIVEAEVQGQSCASFVDHVRGLHVAAPVVVVAPEHAEAIADLKADYVVSNQSLLADLPPVVDRALRRSEEPTSSPTTLLPAYPVSALGPISPGSGRDEKSEAIEAAAARAAATRQAALEERLAQETARRATLEQSLATAASARQEMEQRHAAELAAAEARLADGQARHRSAVERAARICKALEQRALELEAALRQAEEQRAADAADSTDLLGRRQAEFTDSLAEAARSRDDLAQQLSVAKATLTEVRQIRTAQAAAAAEHLARREAELGATVAETVAGRTALEQELDRATRALELAEERAAAERTAIERAAAERATELEESLARETAARQALEQNLADLRIALEESQGNRATEAAAAAERLSHREAELTAALAESGAARSALERALADAEAALQEAQQRAAADLTTATERRAELEDQLARETAARQALEQNLEDAEAARHDAERRHLSEVSTAAARLADVQAQYHLVSVQTSAARRAFEQQLIDAKAALESARQAAASGAAEAAERLAHREAELTTALTESTAARAVLERTLAEAEAAHRDTRQRMAAESAEAAARQADLEDRLSQEAAARSILDADLIAARTASARLRRRFLDAAAGIRRRTRERDARLETQTTHERADHERMLRASEEERRHLELERQTLQQGLATAQDSLRRLHDTQEEDRLRYESAQAASASELQRLTADYDRLRESLDQVRAAFETLEHVSTEHAAERARLESALAERDAQLSTQAERHLAAEQAASAARSQIQEKLDVALETSDREIAQLQRELGALRQELEAARTHGESLQKDAGRVPGLLKQLDQSRQDNRRQFDRAPYGMCRCTPDGAITHANRSFVRLLGYRNADELRNRDLGKAVFDTPADLQWLIEHAAGNGATEWVETTWRKKNRGRLVVRLQLQATSGGSIDIVVENVSVLRSVEEKLRQAQRMEAVGRLASEVAATCENLLRDVSRDCQQWLMALGGEAALRQQGERLLGEVTRAAGFLRKLAVYGDKQVRGLEPVSIQEVLRDLEPILKRVAGDDIQVVLPKFPASADDAVDVESERVERVLVNVASYARERMPNGGRLQIEVGTAVVDGRFLAKHPNVRPGAHVLITVTEVGRTSRPEPALEPRSVAGNGETGGSTDSTGVDLGALLGLISDCGGHLWMTAEPPGNMILKIHLPKRVGEELVDAGVGVPRPERGRSLVKWFRH